MGVATGCGCKEVYRFPHTTYHYSSCICSLFLFTAASLLFVNKKKCFSFLFQYFFVITFYVLNIFFVQYKHTYGQLRASHGSHMKAAHVLYMKKHTQTHTSYPAMDISCMTSRSVQSGRQQNRKYIIRVHFYLQCNFCSRACGHELL